MGYFFSKIIYLAGITTVVRVGEVAQTPESSHFHASLIPAQNWGLHSTF